MITANNDNTASPSDEDLFNMNLHNFHLKIFYFLLSRRYVSCFGNFFYNPVGAFGAFKPYCRPRFDNQANF